MFYREAGELMLEVIMMENHAVNSSVVAIRLMACFSGYYERLKYWHQATEKSHIPGWWPSRMPNRSTRWSRAAFLQEQLILEVHGWSDSFGKSCTFGFTLLRLLLVNFHSFTLLLLWLLFSRTRSIPRNLNDITNHRAFWCTWKF